MKKSTKFTISLASVLFVTFTMLVGVYAKDYSLRRKSTATSSVGTATVYCTATYHSSGNERWDRLWEVYSTGNLKSCSVAKSTRVIKDDRHMNSTVTVSMTTNDYRSGTGTRNLAFRFNGTAVVADN